MYAAPGSICVCVCWVVLGWHCCTLLSGCKGRALPNSDICLTPRCLPHPPHADGMQPSSLVVLVTHDTLAAEGKSLARHSFR